MQGASYRLGGRLDVLRLPAVSAVALASPPAEVRQVSHVEVEGEWAESFQVEQASQIAIGWSPRAAPSDGPSGRAYPIDLANALALGGASHLQIQIARERVVQAEAELVQAQAMWLPSMRLAVGWNKHDGRLQASGGEVIEAGRNSLFVGGGAGLGDAVLAGGSSGPARLMVNLSLADAIFRPWVADRLLDAQDAAEDATTNAALAQIAVAYFDLVQAHGQSANAKVGLEAAEEMAQLTTLFAEEGAGAWTEVHRAEAERAFWNLSLADAKRRTISRSAELVRLLRLDPHWTLVPVEEKIMPVELVDGTRPLEELLEQGLSNRPEVEQYESLIDAAAERVDQEHWRPWLPNVVVGASGGGFGGGPSADLGGLASRGDVDLAAVWELRNLGYGNAALRGQRSSQLRQAQLGAEWVRDTIVAEIVAAAADVASYRRQMNGAMERVISASESYRLNLARIQAAEGLPIELLQAIRARSAALDAYTKAVTDYNRAQFQLLRALGRAPESLQQGADALP